MLLLCLDAWALDVGTFEELFAAIGVRGIHLRGLRVGIAIAEEER